MNRTRFRQAKVPLPRVTSTIGGRGTQPKCKNRVLLALLLFNGLTAVGGGIALVTGVIPAQPMWLQHNDFTSLFFPGVVLTALVGGSALVASSVMIKQVVGWQLSSILSGVIMLVWIVVEIASIRGFHVLQVVYLVTGVAVIWCTPRGAK